MTSTNVSHKVSMTTSVSSWAANQIIGHACTLRHLTGYRLVPQKTSRAASTCMCSLRSSWIFGLSCSNMVYETVEPTSIDQKSSATKKNRPGETKKVRWNKKESFRFMHWPDYGGICRESRLEQGRVNLFLGRIIGSQIWGFKVWTKCYSSY
jgi:hypothetical protein